MRSPGSPRKPAKLPGGEQDAQDRPHDDGDWAMVDLEGLWLLVVSRVLLIVLAVAMTALIYAVMPGSAVLPLAVAAASTTGLTVVGYRRLRRDGVLEYLPQGLRRLLSETTLLDWLMDTSLIDALKPYLVLMMGLNEEEMGYLVRSLPPDQQHRLTAPGLMHVLPEGIQAWLRPEAERAVGGGGFTDNAHREIEEVYPSSPQRQPAGSEMEREGGHRRERGRELENEGEEEEARVDSEANTELDASEGAVVACCGRSPNGADGRRGRSEGDRDHDRSRRREAVRGDGEGNDAQEGGIEVGAAAHAAGEWVGARMMGRGRDRDLRAAILEDTRGRRVIGASAGGGRGDGVRLPQQRASPGQVSHHHTPPKHHQHPRLESPARGGRQQHQEENGQHEAGAAQRQGRQAVVQHRRGPVGPQEHHHHQLREEQPHQQHDYREQTPQQPQSQLQQQAEDDVAGNVLRRRIVRAWAEALNLPLVSGHGSAGEDIGANFARGVIRQLLDRRYLWAGVAVSSSAFALQVAFWPAARRALRRASATVATVGSLAALVGSLALAIYEYEEFEVSSRNAHRPRAGIGRRTGAAHADDADEQEDGEEEEDRRRQTRRRRVLTAVQVGVLVIVLALIRTGRWGPLMNRLRKALGMMGSTTKRRLSL